MPTRSEDLLAASKIIQDLFSAMGTLIDNNMEWTADPTNIASDLFRKAYNALDIAGLMMTQAAAFDAIPPETTERLHEDARPHVEKALGLKPEDVGIPELSDTMMHQISEVLMGLEDADDTSGSEF
jgi:hypothetical protein